MARVLVVDDEALILNVLKAVLKSDGHDPLTVQNGNDALTRLKDEHFDLMISDIRMAPIDGIELLKQVRSITSTLPVILMTGYGTVKSAVDALSLNVFDYVPKPFKVDEFLETVRQALAYGQAITGDDSAEGLLPACKIGQLIAVSPAMLDVCSMIQKVAPVEVPVIISGEFGCGRETVAKTIHECSSRRDNPFLTVPCGEIPEPLVDVMVFGDGTRSNPGLLEQARGGTLFLKDVDLMPLEPLDRMLDVLHKQANGPQGKTSVVARLIGGVTDVTDPEEQRRKANLFQKLSAVEIRIPPLRKRREDILPLISHLIRKKLGEGVEVPIIAPDARTCLKRYNWPGNVNELDVAVDHALKNLDDQRISKQSLSARIQGSKDVQAANAKEDQMFGKQKALKSFLSKPLQHLAKKQPGA